MVIRAKIAFLYLTKNLDINIGAKIRLFRQNEYICELDYEHIFYEK